jgi:hypothetical protein
MLATEQQAFDNNPQRLEIYTITDLQPYLSAWQELANCSAEKNIFYEPCMLVPALRNFDHSNVTLLLIFSTNGERLLGLFPLEYKKSYLGLPFRHYGIWRHKHCFLATPLIAAGHEYHCYRQLFDWLKTQAKPNLFLSFQKIHGDGESYEKLKAYLHDNGCSIDLIDSYQRAFIRSGLSAEDYLAQWSKKWRKNLRKHKAALKKLGHPHVEVLTGDSIDASECDTWTQQFLNLEKSGWKGQEGTALACHENERRFFEELTREAALRGKLLFFRYKLDDKVIAMHIDLRSGHGAFAFKIAYDEAYGKYSPGNLLEYETLAYILDESDLEWVGSCTVQGSTLEHLWMERRLISSLHISRPNMASKTAVSLMAFLRKIKRRIANKKKT